MNTPDIVDVITPVVDALEQLGVAYHIGGSVASSVYGTARSTLDADLVADLKPQQVRPFVEKLEPAYYIDSKMIADAIKRQSSFNVIHMTTTMKVDIFIPKSGPFDRIAFGRARQDTLSESQEARLFYFASPEDVVLRKLEWYKAGGSVSERQWLDVLGVLKVQAQTLDYTHLRRWAEQLGVTDLLDQALKDAGIKRTGA
ncbi:MAG: hypothetical protein ACJ78Q_03425 [Chloroflexia bacterium]